MRETGSRAMRRAMKRPKLSICAALSGRSGRASTCAADHPSAADSNRRASLPAPSMPARWRAAVARRRASPSPTWAASGVSRLLHGCELARVMLGDQSIDQLVERGAFQHLVELVQRQADAVIGDPPLGEIVGADALRAVARADLALALRGPRVGRLLALQLIEARAQHLHGKAAILMLRFLGRDDDEAGRQVRDAHGGIRLIDVLAAG